MTTIKEAAEQFHLSAHAIRYYEKEGLITIPRDENGIRQFDQKALSRLKAITFYRNLGLPLKQIKELVADFHNHKKSLQILQDNLEDLDEKIRELQATKLYVQEKIELHELLLRLEKEGKSEEEQLQAYKDFVAEHSKDEAD